VYFITAISFATLQQNMNMNMNMNIRSINNIRNIKADNNFFERVEQLIYLGQQ